MMYVVTRASSASDLTPFEDAEAPLPLLVTIARLERVDRVNQRLAELRPDVLVLDREVAVFDEQLVSRFHLLGDPDPPVLCTPPMYIVFDVLQVGRKDVRGLPLPRRRSMLEDAIDGSDMVLPVRRLEPSGERAWKTVERP